MALLGTGPCWSWTNRHTAPGGGGRSWAHSNVSQNAAVGWDGPCFWRLLHEVATAVSRFRDPWHG